MWVIQIYYNDLSRLEWTSNIILYFTYGWAKRKLYGKIKDKRKQSTPTCQESIQITNKHKKFN